ncbi:transposase [Streptomyces exfoliatus]|uniref:transposase n=1 Tax=Streptomyces exfoliatus TaxID=1905 RepID=UPI003D677BA7
MLDAIRYLVAGGISWRAMPADFPVWDRVYAFFRRWRQAGLIAEFHDRLRGMVREREGRETEPTAGIIDAQSVRAAASVPAASRGYDGGKKVPGRKRHIVTDCLGLLLVVAVTAANIPDRDAAIGLLGRLRSLHHEITLVWADGGYTGGLVDWAKEKLDLTLQIVKRTDDMGGRGAAETLGGGAHVRVADAFAPPGPRLRNPARRQRGDDPVVDDHADGPPAGPATGRRPTLNIPDASWTNHPRSARRFAFDRTPSTFVGDVSSPSTTAMSLARTGPCPRPGRSSSTPRIRW